ncbi:MAG: hypothetical protein A4E57_04583 [Syntrophorhabdaceae bacterium PtaU1.Bin034]|nr:MAG: hypothetical protein A4E57_04583 [Syntrophorhabdaceae bacterium PtaU1.Bin034]
MAVLQQGRYLVGDFGHREHSALEGLVVPAEGAVDTVVDAYISRINGSKEHKAPPVDMLFYRFCGFHYLVDLIGVLHTEKRRHFPLVQAMKPQGFVQDCIQFVCCRGFFFYEAVKLVPVDKRFFFLMPAHIYSPFSLCFVRIDFTSAPSSLPILPVRALI